MILKSGYLIAIICKAAFVFGQDAESAFDRTAFYKAMAMDQIELVNDQLNALKNSSVKEKEAFEGALTMKKAGLSGAAARKLSLFKSGHKKLEAAIIKDTSNIEFRFLRLMIQEHAPGMLGYKKELNRDSEYIRRYYKTLPRSVQQAIRDYNKKSKVLKLQDS